MRSRKEIQKIKVYILKEGESKIDEYMKIYEELVEKSSEYVLKIFC